MRMDWFSKEYYLCMTIFLTVHSIVIFYIIIAPGPEKRRQRLEREEREEQEEQEEQLRGRRRHSNEGKEVAIARTR